MKKKEDVVVRPNTLTIHIGTQLVKTNREPIVHERSVLEQLKTIIDKNRKMIEESKE